MTALPKSTPDPFRFTKAFFICNSPTNLPTHGQVSCSSLTYGHFKTNPLLSAPFRSSRQALYQYNADAECPLSFFPPYFVTTGSSVSCCLKIGLEIAFSSVVASLTRSYEADAPSVSAAGAASVMLAFDTSTCSLINFYKIAHPCEPNVYHGGKVTARTSRLAGTAPFISPAFSPSLRTETRTSAPV